MTRPLDTILKEEGIRFSTKVVRSNWLAIRPSDDWVLHHRIIGNYPHITLAPFDRVLMALPFVAIAATVLCLMLGWDIALPLGIVATVVAAWLAVRSFERFLDVKRHQHSMKFPVYKLSIQRGSDFCEFFESKDAEEVRLVRDALEDFLTNHSFASTGARRTA